MAYVTSHPGSMSGYALHHRGTQFPVTTGSLQRSIAVSEVELFLDNDVSAPRALPVSPELDKLVRDTERNEDTMTELDTNSILGYHLTPVQGQDQGQDHLTLLTSLNEQTTSLLASYSQLDPQNGQNGQNGEDDTSLLEQALVLGQIALVLVSSLYPGTRAPFSVEWSLDTSQAQAQAQAKGQSHTLEVQAQVLVALAKMGTALVKQFDRTGDRRDLEEAEGLFGRTVVGIEKGFRVERGKTRGIGKGKRKWELGRQEDEGDGGDGDERGEVFVRLEKLEELLGERGFVA